MEHLKQGSNDTGKCVHLRERERQVTKKKVDDRLNSWADEKGIAKNAKEWYNI